MQACWFQVEYLSIDRFIAIIATITNEKFVKTDGLLLYWLVDCNGHKLT